MSLATCHSEDPDGIISSSLLLRVEQMTLSFTPYRNQDQDLWNIPKRFLGNYVIADLNAKQKYLENGVIERILKRSLSMTWFDHHDGTLSLRSDLDTLGVKVVARPRVCTAQQIYEEYLDDDYSEFLAGIAQGHDYPPSKYGGDATSEQLRVGKDLQNIITLYDLEHPRKLQTLAQQLAKDKRWLFRGQYNKTLEEDIAHCELRFNKAFAEARESEVLYDLHGFKIKTFYADPILPPKDTPRNLIEMDEHDSADGYLVFFGSPKNSAMFFRHPESEFNAEIYCSAMGGGGREGDGGFGLPLNCSKGEYPIVRSLVLAELDEVKINHSPSNSTSEYTV